MAPKGQEEDRHGDGLCAAEAGEPRTGIEEGIKPLRLFQPPAGVCTLLRSWARAQLFGYSAG